jgi:predicted RNA methylase
MTANDSSRMDMFSFSEMPLSSMVTIKHLHKKMQADTHLLGSVTPFCSSWDRLRLEAATVLAQNPWGSKEI